MAEAIRDFREQTGRAVGLKLAGGIRNAKMAWQYLVIVGETLGPEWLRPERFRLGASSLLNDLLMQRRWLATGRYQRPDDFTDRLMTDLTEPAEFTLEYASAPESTAIVSLRDTYGLWIGGEWVEPRSGNTFPTINPATEEQLAVVAEAGEEDVDLAVAAARKAFESGWRDLPGRERAKYLYRIARLLQERSREFAVLETLDGGKPIKESRDVDLPLAAAHFFHYAGWADKLDYAFAGRRAKPIGVAGQVIPWNFPMLMASWKLAPALATGQHRRAQAGRDHAADRAAAGRGAAGRRPAAGRRQHRHRRRGDGRGARDHPDVDKVAFTGSTDVGKRIQTELAGTGKRLTLELGGKAANIVFEDAALDQAVEGVVNGIWFNQGHVCCAGSRLLVQETRGRPLPRPAPHRAWTRCGSATRWTRTPTSAPSTARSSWRRSGSWWRSGVDEGAEIYQPRRACCPTRASSTPRRSSPASSQSHRIAREEIFGPVLSVLTFRTPDEAVEKANNTPYGLSAGVWTEKGSRILWMAERLQAGVVWANTFNQFDPTSPFGGYKESGFGREGGRHGLAPYLELEPV